MASLKVEIRLKKKKPHPEHKYSVTFVSKVGTIIAHRDKINFANNQKFHHFGSIPRWFVSMQKLEPLHSLFTSRK